MRPTTMSLPTFDLSMRPPAMGRAILVLMSMPLLLSGCTRALSSTTCQESQDCYSGEACVAQQCVSDVGSVSDMDVDTRPDASFMMRDMEGGEDVDMMEAPDLPTTPVEEEEMSPDMRPPSPELARLTRRFDIKEGWLPGSRVLTSQQGRLWALVMEKDHLHLLGFDGSNSQVEHEIHIEKGFHMNRNPGSEKAALFEGEAGELHVLYEAREKDASSLYHVRIDTTRHEISSSTSLGELEGGSSIASFDLVALEGSVRVALSHGGRVQVLSIEEDEVRQEMEVRGQSASPLAAIRFTSARGDAVCGLKGGQLECHHEASAWQAEEISLARGVAHLWSWPQVGLTAMIHGEQELLYGQPVEESFERRRLGQANAVNVAMTRGGAGELMIMLLDAQGKGSLNATNQETTLLLPQEERFEQGALTWGEEEIYIMLENGRGKGEVELYVVEN